MRLAELEPRLLRWEQRIEDGRLRTFHVKVDNLADAQGVLFLCPKCFKALGGKIGCHSIVCWSRSRGTPELAEPGPGRWALAGTSLDDLTLNGDIRQPPETGLNSRSVQLLGGCAWHGYVTDGEVSDA